MLIQLEGPETLCIRGYIKVDLCTYQNDVEVVPNTPCERTLTVSLPALDIVQQHTT